jgi:N-acetylglucosaminyl-diphospho-decaprenol L-rhamnosyltransferase
MARTTALVVTYNSGSHLVSCLSNLEIPIVIIDNASTDHTLDIARHHPGVHRLIRNPQNIGLASAINLGLRYIETEYILVLNPDVKADPAGIAALERWADTHPQSGVVAPQLRYLDGTIQASARSFPTLATMLARRTVLGRTSWGKNLLVRHEEPHFGESSEVDWALGAALLIRSRAIEDVGGMDEHFFLYNEDIDWCARMWRNGWQVLYHPEVSFRHEYQRQSRHTLKFWDAATRHHLASTLRLAWRYPKEMLIGDSLRTDVNSPSSRAQ